jgi:hypothetical protein
MEKKLKGHGDINVEKFEGEITGEIIKHTGSFTLAEGEQTGHRHVITVPSVDDMDVYKTADGGLFLVLRKEGTVTHEEHTPIKIVPGTYRIDREREHDYFQKATRRVID